MLDALRQLFTSGVQTWLIVLKYMGLALAAGSSVWGTTNDLTTTTSDGQRLLTRAGRISILLTIVGPLLSIIFEDLQRRDPARTQAAQVTAEAQRTNEIILAGQPLTSLSLHLQFASASPALWEAMTKGKDDMRKNADTSQGGTPEVPFDVEEYRAALMPLFSYVARIGGGRRSDQIVDAGQAGDGVDDASIVVLITPRWVSKRDTFFR